MTIHKVTARRAEARPTLNYMYRGDGHEHEINLIKHLGGNIFCFDPIIRDQITGLPIGVELDNMTEEFNAQAALHLGKGEKLFKHYIISLAPNEQLKDHEWFEHINDDYLPALGYDPSCVWTAVQHDDKDHSHVHILACTVKGDGSLVKSHNDAKMGFDSMRKLELKYDLRKLESPDQNWGKHFTKAELKAADGDRKLATERDEASIIRARFKAIESENGGKLPYTMTKLVVALARKNIEVKCRQDASGKITGISYRADNKVWIGGSRIKASRLTFQNLQRKEHVSYIPGRDDVALGVATAPDRFTVSFKISTSQFKKIKAKKAPHRVRDVDRKLWVDFTFCRSKRDRELAIIIANAIELINILFNNDSAYFDILFDLEMQRRYEALYDPVSVAEYNLDDEFNCMSNLDEDTYWRHELSDTEYIELAS